MANFDTMMKDSQILYKHDNEEPRRVIFEWSKVCRSVVYNIQCTHNLIRKFRLHWGIIEMLAHLLFKFLYGMMEI